MSKSEHQAPARVLQIDLMRNTMTWSYVDKTEGTLYEAKARSRKWSGVLSWLFKVLEKRRSAKPCAISDGRRQ